jgi:coproporphyrinogen III oxidase-like Fe-S oxidoreductase
VLDGAALVREALLLGLRTEEGVNLVRTAERAGIDPLKGRDRALERALERGNVVIEGGHLRVPKSRWLHLDSIVTDLF